MCKVGAKILPTNEAMAQALQNEEVGICIMWKARAVQWQKAGAKAERSRRKKEFRHISGSSSQERTEQGRRAFLAERDAPAVGAGGLRRGHGYNGSVTNARFRPIRKRIGFTRRAQAPHRSPITAISRQRRRAQGVVGQVVQRLTFLGPGRISILGVTDPCAPGGAGVTAAAMIAPASIVATIGTSRRSRSCSAIASINSRRRR